MAKQQEPTETTALATVEQMLKDKRLAGRWNAHRTNKELKFANECRHALEIVKASKKLQECSPDTVRECIEDVAILGLTLDKNLQHAYLVPRFIKGRGMVCTLYTSWRGLRVAAGRWGNLLDMTAQCVYSNEPFELHLGTHPDVRHQVIPNAKSRGAFVGAYCIAYMQSGIVKVEYMDEDQIARARAVSESQDGQYSPWGKWFEEMARKTVVRRAAKHWQGTAELAATLQVQNKYEGMGTPVADDDDAIESVATLDDEQITALHAKATDAGMDGDKVLGRVARVMGVQTIGAVAAHRFHEAEEWVQKAIDHHNQRVAANG